MHTPPDDDYEPEHDQYLDEDGDLDAMFADELAEEDPLQPAAPPTAQPDEDDLDDYQDGLDEDY